MLKQCASWRANNEPTLELSPIPRRAASATSLIQCSRTLIGRRWVCAPLGMAREPNALWPENQAAWAGLDQTGFGSQAQNAEEKLAIAARLRKETALTAEEIAARVSLGTSKSADGKLHRL
jgi:hypothetical protein